MTIAINASAACERRDNQTHELTEVRTLQSYRRFTEQWRRRGQNRIQSLQYYEEDRRGKP